MLKSKQYIELNGHSNLFWGWGREDNDIEWRIRQRGYEIQKPDLIDYGRYTMISHTHDLGFQSEKKLKNIEDSISSQIHSILMKDTKFLRINVDGLSSVVENYKISSFVQRSSFSKISFDIDRIKNFTAEIQVLGQSKFLALESRKSCHFIEVENSNFDRSYVQNEGANVKLYHKNVDFDICGQGCLGIGTKRTENGPLFFPVKAPVLKKTPGQNCWFKECKNDSSGFQFMEIWTNETDINLQVNFNMEIQFQPVGDFYFRFSMVYEGQKIKEGNIRILGKRVSENNVTVTFTSSKKISLKSEFDMKNMNDGFYLLFTKLVDSIGQPYGEVNWIMRLRNGKTGLSRIDKQDNKDLVELAKSNMLTQISRM